MEIFLSIFAAILWIISCCFFYLKGQKNVFDNRSIIPLVTKLETIENKLAVLQHNSDLQTDSVKTILEEVPGKVLHSVQGSINNKQGKLGELVAFIQMKAGFDKILPMAGLTDFLGIKFAHNDNPGEIVFIEVKSGGARLSDEQKNIRDVIKNGKVSFQQFRISSD